MKFLKYIVLTLVAFVLILTAACKNNARSDGHHHHHLNSKKQSSVWLSEEQIENAQIKFSSGKPGVIKQSFLVTGNTELPPANMSSISFQLHARIKSINVIVGQKVNKGEALAVVEGLEIINLHKNFFQSKNRLIRLNDAIQRKKDLIANNAISQKEWSELVMDRNNAAYEFEALNAQFKLLNILPDSALPNSCVIRAEIDGNIAKSDFNIGHHIDPNDVLFEIINPVHLHVDLNLHEKDLSKVKIGQSIEVFLTSSPGKVYSGEIYALGNVFDELKGIMKAHAEVHIEDEKLYPGMIVQAKVFSLDSGQFVVPQPSIIREGEKTYIFCKEEEKNGKWKFTKNEVHILNEDEWFVNIANFQNFEKKLLAVENAFYIQAELRKSEGGHAH